MSSGPGSSQKYCYLRFFGLRLLQNIAIYMLLGGQCSQTPLFTHHLSAPLPIGQNVWTKNCNIKSAFFFKLGTWPIHFSAALTAHGCKLKLQSFAEHEYVSGCVMQGAFVNKASWHQSTYPTMPSARLQTHSFLIECPISKCRHESNHTAHPLTCHSPRPHHTTSETS